MLLKAPHFENSGIWQGKEGSIGETKHMRSEVEPHLQMQNLKAVSEDNALHRALAHLVFI